MLTARPFIIVFFILLGGCTGDSGGGDPNPPPTNGNVDMGGTDEKESDGNNSDSVIPGQPSEGPLYGFITQGAFPTTRGSDNYGSTFARFKSSAYEKRFLDRINQTKDTCVEDSAYEDKDADHRSVFPYNSINITSQGNTVDEGKLVIFDNFGVLHTYDYAPDDSAHDVSAIADIPGADFPSFNTIRFPAIDLFPSYSRSREDPMSLSWTPPTLPNSVIRIGVIAETSTQGDIYFRCVAADDGAFHLPTDVRDFLNSSNVANYRLVVGREAVEILTDLGTTLVVSHYDGDVR